MASNKMLIDASHREETRVVVLRGNRIEEFDFESQNRRQLKGNIYLAKVTRVEPSLQAAFVDYGGNRHGFLAFSEIHPDYYQIPMADRKALLEQEAADAQRDRAEDDREEATLNPKDADDDSDQLSDQVDENDESASAEGSAKEREESQETEKPKRRRRSRRKSAKAKDDVADTGEDNTEDGNADDPKPDGDASKIDDDAELKQEKEEKSAPDSIAAMMDVDSISEPAPEDEPDQPENEEAEEKPKKKATRSTRRPRRKAKAKTDDEVKAVSDEEVSTAKSDENENEVTSKEAEKESDTETEETVKKAKPRRRKRSTKSKSTKNEDDSSSEKSQPAAKTGNRRKAKSKIDDRNGDSDVVESTGQGDALEEVPKRRRSFRQYKIQEVVKRRQVLLVQVVKEERGNKGAALTTYLSLAGRYSVLMPNTARGGGISRKITNVADRKRLKTIASELEVPEGMGVILRTAGASRTKAEIQRDFEYLMRLWENVRSLTLSSSAPCLVYEEGSLIKRSIRDLYDKNTGEVLVAGEAGHKEAQDFMEMLMPSHAKKIKLYRDEQAMFARFGVEQQLDKMLSQQVTLKSGGYLVIDQTEALVAIDVNSGRATREHSIEDTALQTNLETAEEVARQLRLRDLAGLIVIDFIDMEEKRNNRAVEKKLKDCLKNDRARIQVGRISHFGLMEMSRQRMRASVLESTMDVCPHCQGKGHLRSNSTVSLHILRAIEEHLLKSSRFDLVVKAASDIALFILNSKRLALMEIEERFGMRISIEGSRDLLGEDFTIEKGEASTGERKPITHIQAGQVSHSAQDEESTEIENEEDQKGKRKRGRRRGRGNNAEENPSSDVERSENSVDANSKAESVERSDSDSQPKRRRNRGKRGGRSRNNTVENPENSDAVQTTESESNEEPQVNATVENHETGETVTKSLTRNSRPRKAKTATTKPVEDNGEAETTEPETKKVPQKTETEPKRAKRRTSRRKPAAEEEHLSGDDEPRIPEAIKASIEPVEDTPAPAKEKKRGGWWSRNGFFK